MNFIITNGYTYWNDEVGYWTANKFDATVFDSVVDLPSKLGSENNRQDSVEIFLTVYGSGKPTDIFSYSNLTKKIAWLEEVK